MTGSEQMTVAVSDVTVTTMSWYSRVIASLAAVTVLVILYIFYQMGYHMISLTPLVALLLVFVIEIFIPERFVVRCSRSSDIQGPIVIFVFVSAFTLYSHVATTRKLVIGTITAIIFALLSGIAGGTEYSRIVNIFLFMTAITLLIVVLLEHVTDINTTKLI